jgi:hypothetical protein
MKNTKETPATCSNCKTKSNGIENQNDTGLHATLMSSQNNTARFIYQII